MKTIEQPSLEDVKKELEKAKSVQIEIIGHIDKLAQFTRDLLSTIRGEKGHSPIAQERLKNHYQRIGEILRSVWNTKVKIR